jgi:hypothetical protein
MDQGAGRAATRRIGQLGAMAIALSTLPLAPTASAQIGAAPATPDPELTTGPSLEETEKWISEEVPEYSSYLGDGLARRYRVVFSGCSVRISEESWYRVGDGISEAYVNNHYPARPIVSETSLLEIDIRNSGKLIILKPNSNNRFTHAYFHIQFPLTPEKAIISDISDPKATLGYNQYLARLSDFSVKIKTQQSDQQQQSEESRIIGIYSRGRVMPFDGAGDSEMALRLTNAFNHAVKLCKAQGAAAPSPPQGKERF